MPTQNENHTAKFRVRKRRAGAYHGTGARAARSPQPLQPPGYSPPKSSLPSSRALFIFETLGVLLPALRPGSRCAARWSSGIGMVAKVFSPIGVDIGRRLVSAGRHTGVARWTMSPPRTRPARPGAGCGGALSSNGGTGAHRHRHGARRQLRPGHIRWGHRQQELTPTMTPGPPSPRSAVGAAQTCGLATTFAELS